LPDGRHATATTARDTTSARTIPVPASRSRRSPGPFRWFQLPLFLDVRPVPCAMLRFCSSSPVGSSVRLTCNIDELGRTLDLPALPRALSSLVKHRICIRSRREPTRPTIRERSRLVDRSTGVDPVMGDPSPLDAAVRQAAARFPGTAAVIHNGSSTSWADVDALADSVGHGLAGAGVEPGDVVASVLPSGAEWLILAVSLSRIGAIHAAISSHLAAPERAAAAALVRPVLTVTDPTGVEGLPLRSSVTTIEPGGRCEELRHRGSPTLTTTTPRGMITNICFTSGTTGRPKGASFGPDQLDAVTRIDLGTAAGAWGGGAAMLASTHFAHVGMALKLPWYARTASTLCVMDRWNADEALEIIERHRMPTVGGVAAQISLMLRSDTFDERDLRCVERLIVGGAPSSAQLVDEARRRFNASYSIRYSSTESGGVGLATSETAEDDEALHTVGRPRPGVEVRIVGDDGQPMRRGETGELELRSAAVTCGYWNDSAATAATIDSDGWLRSGDLAHVDPRGCVVIDGRRNDMMIRGGYNVFPVEVESALLAHPGIEAVAVAPRPDDVLGEVPVAVVVPDPTAPTPTLEELRGFAAGALARHKLPHDLVVVDHLPLTTADKLDRRTLRRWVLAGPESRSTAEADETTEEPPT